MMHHDPLLGPLPSDTLLWIFRGAIGVASGVIGWLVIQIYLDSKRWRAKMELKVEVGLHQLGNKIDGVERRVMEQNGSIGLLNKEMKDRIEFSRERHEKNMEEHREMFDQIHELALLRAEQRVEAIRTKKRKRA